MEMLTCHLDKTCATPLYEQLYSYIKKEIITGRLPFGEKLPSKRTIVNLMKVSQNTVETAYDQLIAEGYVESIARKGYYILAKEDLAYVDQTIPEEREETEGYTWDYQFHPGKVDTAHFPFSKWRKYAKQVIDEDNQSLLLLGDMQGEYSLRKQIAKYLYQARGITCIPDDIIIGAGTEMLLQQLVLLFGNQTTYGVEDPGYHAISHILKQYPNKVSPLRVDENGLNVKQLENTAIDLVYVTPSHHFPYGSVLSVNRRVKLLNWAQSDSTRYIIEDDYDSEFRYSGKPIPSLESMDKSNKVIYLGSFSKSLIPSLRISYMVLPPTLTHQYKRKFSFYQCAVSRMSQNILAAFMASGDFGKHLNRMRTVYRRKRDITLKVLKPYQDIRIIGEQSGLHVVLEVNNGMAESELVQHASNNNIEIYPLSRYALGEKKQNPPQMVLGFAGIPEDELEVAIKKLLKSWEEGKRSVIER